MDPAKVLGKFDLLKGYWQVPLSVLACEISAFIAPSGLYEYTVMSFRVRNALRLMNIVVMQLEECEVYLDDMVINSDLWDVHVWWIRALFNHLAAEMRQSGQV